MFDPSRSDILADPEIWGAFGRGVLNTLRMAGVAAVLAIVIGILFSFGRTAASKWVRIPDVDRARVLPRHALLLLIFFVFLMFSTGGYWAGVLGLALYNGAIIGEALRAGISSLPKGQREGGLSIGLTSLQTRFIVEFPQAFRQMLPIIFAQLVVLLERHVAGVRRRVPRAFAHDHRSSRTSTAAATSSRCLPSVSSSTSS